MPIWQHCLTGDKIVPTTPEQIAADWINEATLHRRHSLRSLEDATGISRAKLNDLQNGKGSLRCADVVSLSRVLNKNPCEVFGQDDYDDPAKLAFDKIVQIAERRLLNPSPNDVVSWISDNRTNLDVEHPMAKSIVFANIPDRAEGSVSVLSVGEGSLTSDALKSSDPRAADDYFQRLPPSEQVELFESYLTAWEREEPQVFARTKSSFGTVFQYVTVLYSARTSNGNDVIANHSTLIGRRAA